MGSRAARAAGVPKPLGDGITSKQARDARPLAPREGTLKGGQPDLPIIAREPLMDSTRSPACLSDVVISRHLGPTTRRRRRPPRPARWPRHDSGPRLAPDVPAHGVAPQAPLAHGRPRHRDARIGHPMYPRPAAITSHGGADACRRAPDMPPAAHFGRAPSTRAARRSPESCSCASPAPLSVLELLPPGRLVDQGKRAWGRWPWPSRKMRPGHGAPQSMGGG